MFNKKELIILRDTMDELRDFSLEEEREDEPEIWKPFEKLYNKIIKMIKEED